MDWSQVQEHARHAPNQGSVLHSPGACNSKSSVAGAPSANKKTSVSSGTQSSATVKTESSGTDSGQVLMRPYRTFVDVQEMLDAKEQMFKNQDKAVFELFGRVVYSSRENFQKKQYFQFRSLLKEQPPYINGTLVHWEVGSPQDIAAQDFLKKRPSHAKCFCRCKLKQDPRAKTGWVVIVLKIRQSGWKEIQKVMDTLGRKDLDEPTSSSGN
ncbi:hypothetical protein CEP51_010879 [Fusarium floridanum]|uniref:Uncharacterized protein n=1 Tax=Fusarium floridanum TaxID=1325733 RepID=A0A428RD13_9HYPO|nr:hypothetical protein CEP51_010879 [Fusarium floridanum]